MASARLSRRVEKVVAYPPLCEMSKLQRREFHERRGHLRGSAGEVAGGDPEGRGEPAEAAGRVGRVVLWRASSVAYGRLVNEEFESDDAKPECAVQGDRSKRREGRQPRGAGDD
jgi:hypothetical protein